MRQVVSFQFGGVQHDVKCALELALKIEERTGRGLLALGREIRDQNAKLGDALGVVGVALAHAGKTYTSRDLTRMAMVEGVHNVYDVALSIIAEFFRQPEDADAAEGDEGNGRRAKPSR